MCASLVAAPNPGSFESAKDLFELGQLEDAEQAFEILVASDPKAAEVNFYLGEIALRQNAPVKAVTWFERSVAAAPAVSRYHHRLGDAFGRAAQEASIFSALGLARKCLRAYQRAVELDPGNLDARFSLFLFYRNAPGIIGGGADRAAAEAAAIARADPDRGRIAIAALHVSKKKYEDARAVLAEIRPVDLAQVSGNAVFLSDARWTSAKVGWGAPVRNHAWFDERSPQGFVLIVHGRLYAKGLYAHSPSQFVFALESKWNVFRATLGLRDGADAQGSAIFIIRGDGRELFRSAVLRVNASEHVTIDVRGVNELELVTESGEGHNRSSWAIWAEPTLRR
jgi:tetratricopeptide (TPR) repeat protein